MKLVVSKQLNTYAKSKDASETQSRLSNLKNENYFATEEDH